MAFPTQDGERKYGSKFRASRYDRENSNPDSGPRSQANDLKGTGDVESRLHNNPHSEKFNTPLHGPQGQSDPQEPGEQQEEAQEMHNVTCPHCGGEVPVTGDTNHSDDMAPMSEDEKAVHEGKKAKGVWKPGQREHPDAGGDTDDFEPEIL